MSEHHTKSVRYFMPKSTRDRIIAEYTAGSHDLTAVAIRHGVSREATCTLLRRRGLIVRQRATLSDDLRKLIVNGYGRNATARTVAKQQGVGKTTVLRVLKKAGVHRLPPSVRGPNRELEGTGERWCTRCGWQGPESEFSTNIRRRRSKENVCKVCSRHKSKASLRKQRERKGRLIDSLKGATCLDCGLAFPVYVLDFDHVRGKKRFNISEALQSIWTAADIIEEAAKCEVVCSNCHRIRTHGRTHRSVVNPA